MVLLLAAALGRMLLLAGLAAAGSEPPPAHPRYNRTLKAWRGSTPHIDGVLSPGEWDDGFEIVTVFAGTPSTMQWAAEFSEVTDPADLSMHGWLKHDDKALYLGFQITDDLLHGVQTAHWAPPANPQVDALNQSGWPWFGDEMEILLNAAGPPDECAPSDPSRPHSGGLEVVGNETEWQMVLNLAKSRLGGVGVGGLLEGEPRDSLSAWNNYGLFSGQQISPLSLPRSLLRPSSTRANDIMYVYSAEQAAGFSPAR